MELPQKHDLGRNILGWYVDIYFLRGPLEVEANLTTGNVCSRYADIRSQL